MGQILDENPMKSEVMGRCDGDENNPNDHAEPTTSIAKKTKTITNMI